MRNRLFTYLFALCLCCHISVTADPIKIEKMQGTQIDPYLAEIIQFVTKMYRDYPYLYNGDDAGYQQYLNTYAQAKEGVIFVAFDGKKIVGVASGMPMADSRDIFKPTLVRHGYSIKNIYYIGEFGVSPEYHGKGIESTLMSKMEQFIKEHKQYNTISLWELNPASSSQTQRAPTHFPNGIFLQNNGFAYHPELNFIVHWTNINEKHESPHLAVYWLKDLR